jgi:hypothetical protein
MVDGSTNKKTLTNGRKTDGWMDGWVYDWDEEQMNE